MACVKFVLFILTSFAVFSVHLCFPAREEVNSVYESCPEGDPNKLNVHLVCHTHNDVGWLKTVDQYFYGANQTIQRAGVQYILDSVIASLLRNSSRRFVYVETAFFARWWNEQPETVRNQVKNLACSGQLQFAGGGWSMNDEATTHYNSIIDQMTWGLRFLNDTLGSCGLPTVAWQIDPFGHSREQASLFAQMYFDGLFFGRLDYQDKDTRMKNKSMELLWKGSQTLGPLADLFTGALPNSYSPPSGFCFDILCNDQPIMDDKRLKDYNVEERVEKFINITRQQAQNYATNHLVMTMGNDFNYQNAEMWFKNLDKLIAHVNAKSDSNITVFYSTPACYLYSLHQQKRKWTKKYDDFLPYASDPHAYWSGYFTSRPSVKRYERIGNNILQVCKQLASIADVGDYNVTVMREAMGIMQHHDAVTGTEKQHVTSDYEQTLASAIKVCQEDVINLAYKKIVPKAGYVLPDQVFCNFLNQSECSITESGKPVAVTIYNPLGWNISTYIRLPVTRKAYKVYGPDGNAVAAQVVDIPATVKSIPGRKSNATNEVVFRVELPPVGYATYLVRNSSSSRLAKFQHSKYVQKEQEDWSIQNEFLKLFVDGKTGLLKLVQLANGRNVSVNQSFYWYRGMDGNNTEFQFRASGAYIFRPNGTTPIPLGSSVNVTVVNGSLVQEVRQVFNPWLSQIIRLYKGVDNIEFDWIVGQIPVEDGVGKEIITRFGTDIPSEEIFSTDSNGREILERRRNSRQTWTLNVTEPVAGNYYPVNSRIFIKSGSDIQVTVLTDRSQGGSSLQSGSIELMIHRRLLHDDAFGVGEALNETGVDGKGLVIRGKHYLIISEVGHAASKHRPLAQKLYLQPQLSFFNYNGSEAEFLKNISSKFSGFQPNKTLPLNAHLLTLEPWKDSKFLLRLENFYEVGEDESLSRPTTVDLKDLFSPFKIASLEETTLSANQFISSAKRLRWETEGKNKRFMSRITANPSCTPTGTYVVSLNPMRICTFIVGIKR